MIYLGALFAVLFAGFAWQIGSPKARLPPSMQGTW